MREEVAAHYRAKGYTIRERVQVRGASGAVHSVEMVVQGPLGNLVVAFEDAGGFEGPEFGAVRRIARDIGATPVVAARRFEDALRRHAAQSGVVLLDEAALLAAPAAPPADAQELEYPPWPDPGAAREAREHAPWPAARAPVPRAGAEAPTQIGDGTRPVQQSKSTDPGFWRYPRPGADAEDGPRDAPADAARPSDAGLGTSAPRPTSRFAWLDGPAASKGQAAGMVRSPARGGADQARAGIGPSGRPANPVVAGRPADPAPHARPAPRRSAPTPTAPWARWAAIGAGFGASAAVVLYALLRLLG